MKYGAKKGFELKQFEQRNMADHRVLRQPLELVEQTTLVGGSVNVCRVWCVGKE